VLLNPEFFCPDITSMDHLDVKIFKLQRSL
jgi:hypothetical protein